MGASRGWFPRPFSRAPFLTWHTDGAMGADTGELGDIEKKEKLRRHGSNGFCFDLMLLELLDKEDDEYTSGC